MSTEHNNYAAAVNMSGLFRSYKVKQETAEEGKAGLSQFDLENKLIMPRSN